MNRPPRRPRRTYVSLVHRLAGLATVMVLISVALGSGAAQALPLDTGSSGAGFYPITDPPAPPGGNGVTDTAFSLQFDFPDRPDVRTYSVRTTSADGFCIRNQNSVNYDQVVPARSGRTSRVDVFAYLRNVFEILNPTCPFVGSLGLWDVELTTPLGKVTFHAALLTSRGENTLRFISDDETERFTEFPYRVPSGMVVRVK